MQTREQALAWQRKNRKHNNNAATKRYEKTVNGFLMRAYRNMLSRTLGLVKPHLYAGLPILSREKFYQWARQDSTFHRLFSAWRLAGYNRKLSPSIDRVDPEKGYVLTNIRWLTHSENSARILRKCR